MKMTLQRAENLVHVQQHHGKHFYQKIFFKYVRKQDQRLTAFSLYFCTNSWIFFTDLRGWDNKNAIHCHQVDVRNYQHGQDDNNYQSVGKKT